MPHPEIGDRLLVSAPVKEAAPFHDGDHARSKLIAKPAHELKELRQFIAGWRHHIVIGARLALAEDQGGASAIVAAGNRHDMEHAIGIALEVHLVFQLPRIDQPQGGKKGWASRQGGTILRVWR